MRRHNQRLACDFLAVLSGCRPAFMLDYGLPCDAEALAAACQLCAQKLCGSSQAAMCIVMGWQGLLWVMNPVKIQERWQRICSLQHCQPDAHEIWFVNFDDSASGQVVLTPTDDPKNKVCSAVAA